MAHHSPIFKLTRTRAATLLCIASIGSALAQNTPPEITITSPSPQQVSGFGDTPLSKAPFSAISIDNQSMRDVGAKRISDALKLDASVTDSYNSPAYWDMLSVRGYTLDNRYNYRREGLPISAETMIPMENKERIELLKGTSGIQAGTSSPGGLANYVVKRAPTGKDETIRSVTASYGNGKSSSVALDLGSRFGESKEFGYRFNTAYEDLNPYIKNTQGHRNMVALAMDWRMSADSRLEFEFEKSERQQMGVNGYSLLDNRLPTTVDGKLNITRQAWTVPAEFKANTGSIRFKQNLGSDWLWTSQYGSQRLRTDDRLSFASGYNYYETIDNPIDTDSKFRDRYTSDGRFELNDYRSNNEQRSVDALQTELNGKTRLGSKTHHLSFSLTRQRQLDRLPPMQAWNPVGEGSIKGGGNSQPNPLPEWPNTNRSEYSTEIAAKDRIELNVNTSVWIGLRYTTYSRSSEQNAICNPVCTPAVAYNLMSSKGSITTPWVGLTHQVGKQILFVSHGHGIEMLAAPNTPLYSNPGRLLEVGRSKQTELGIRSLNTNYQQSSLNWDVSIFQINRPFAYDAMDGDSLKRVSNGQQVHQGIGAGLQWTQKQWLLSGQAQWLHARISGVPAAHGIGDQPLNVPAITLRALAQYRWTEIPGLRTSLRLSHEGQRRVKEDGSINLPAWTTMDFAAHYETRIQGTRSELTLGIDNLMNKHYWRESPKQFGHYYLYPGAPRNLRLTVRTLF